MKLIWSHRTAVNSGKSRERREREMEGKKGGGGVGLRIVLLARHTQTQWCQRPAVESLAELGLKSVERRMKGKEGEKDREKRE